MQVAFWFKFLLVVTASYKWFLNSSICFFLVLQLLDHLRDSLPQNEFFMTAAIGALLVVWLQLLGYIVAYIRRIRLF